MEQPKWLKKDEQTGKYSIDGITTFNEVMLFMITSIMELYEEVRDLYKEFDVR